MLCDALGATRTQAATVERLKPSSGLEDGALTPESIGDLLAVLIPENAIVVDEAVSTGRNFDHATRQAALHEWLRTWVGPLVTGCRSRWAPPLQHPTGGS